jgi:glycosyltransferase involved in cell wall biosynthesis
VAGRQFERLFERVGVGALALVVRHLLLDRECAVNEPPLVSVIIPAYNHARYIEECLESVYTDSYPEIEVLVLDDGSSDDTFEVARRWREAHPGRFRQFRLERQENQGITRTLNRLISWTQGDFVALLASDDLLIDGGLLARVNELENQPDLFAVFGDCTVINTDGDKIAESGLEFLGANLQSLHNRKHLARELILNWSIPGPGFMAKKSCFDQKNGIGFYDTTLLYEDRYYYIRLLSRNAIKFVKKNVSYYRVHTNNFIVNPGKREISLETVIFSDLKNYSIFRGINRYLLLINIFHCYFVLSIWKKNYVKSFLLFPLWIFCYLIKRLLAPRGIYKRSRNFQIATESHKQT